jgi:hypothetical protein
MTPRTLIAPTKRRAMTKARAANIFLANQGRCYLCGRQIRDGEKYEIEHPDALWAGGSDDDAALKPVHVKCHAGKTKAEAAERAKRNRIVTTGFVGDTTRKRPIPGSRNSPFKKRMNGQTEWRGHRT